MCVIFVAANYLPQYKLVVAANRDEFHQRPTASAGFWENDFVLAGKDLEAGGTWLGVNRRGGFAAVTNFRQPSELTPKPKSRGALAADFLSCELPMYPPEAAERLTADADDYAGYNLLLGNSETLVWTSNLGGRKQIINSGIHAMSNALLNTPWPKVRDGKKRLKSMLDDGQAGNESLFQLLANQDVPSDEELPDTGVGRAMERLLGSVFITGAHYGTRASTVVKIGQDGKVEFAERSFGPNGVFLAEAAFEFQSASA